MKILFDHSDPFLLAHGGFQIQIEKTMEGLKSIGVDVEPLRWWDSAQSGDLIHFFSTASSSYLRLARSARMPVVMTTLFTETCNRSDFQLNLQGLITKGILALPFGKGITNQLRWKAFKECKYNVVGLEAERKVLKSVYGISAEAISIIPLGLSENYLCAGTGDRSENHLICTGTITRRKNSLLLAEMARTAEVPILFVGKPYHTSDPYWREFERRIDEKWAKYKPHVESENEMITLLKSARGFVLLSDYENWCLSAHEAAACGLPLLIPDQKWSRECFGQSASYLKSYEVEKNVSVLRQFYEQCASLPTPNVKHYSWVEVATKLKSVYERALKTSW